MKINNIAPVVFGILLITLLALATSCTTQEKMLKIYATIMTTIFLAIWIPTMAIVLKEVFMQVILPIFK